MAPKELGSWRLKNLGHRPAFVRKCHEERKVLTIDSQLQSMHGVFHDECNYKWNGCHEISYVDFSERMRHN